MRISYLLLVICTFGAVFGATNNTVIFNGCTTAEVGPIRIDNVCVTMKQEGNCAIDTIIKVGGKQIVEENLDLGIIPAICGGYSPPPLFPPCSLCAGIFPNPRNKSSECVLLTGSCSGVSLPTVTVGCFDQAILKNISDCRSQLCPANCSGNGICKNGNCTCNSGWYGDDCASNTPFFQSCFQVSQFGDPVCAELKFYNTCYLETGFTVGNTHILNYTISMDNFRRGLAVDICSKASLCKSCIGWKDLVLNKTAAAGCAVATVECFDNPLLSYSLGCFEDDTIVPKCFGSCPNECNLNGKCDRGKCLCHHEWQGEDCSEKACSLTCAHGTCDANGVCQCIDHFSGPNCDTPSEVTTTGGTNPDGHHSNTAAIVVPVVFFVLIGVALGAVYWYKYKRNRTTQFRALDLVEGESLMDEEEQPTSRFASLKAKLSFDN